MRFGNYSSNTFSTGVSWIAKISHQIRFLSWFTSLITFIIGLSDIFHHLDTIFLFLKFVCQQTFSISYNYVFAYFLLQDEVDELEWIVSYIFQSSVEKNFLLRLKYLIKSRKLSFDVSLSCIITLTGAKNGSFWDIKFVILWTKVHS